MKVQLKHSRKTIKKMRLAINELKKKIGSQRENLEELHEKIFCMEKETSQSDVMPSDMYAQNFKVEMTEIVYNALGNISLK